MQGSQRFVAIAAIFAAATEFGRRIAKAGLAATTLALRTRRRTQRRQRRARRPQRQRRIDHHGRLQRQVMGAIPAADDGFIGTLVVAVEQQVEAAKYAAGAAQAAMAAGLHRSAATADTTGAAVSRRPVRHAQDLDADHRIHRCNAFYFGFGGGGITCLLRLHARSVSASLGLLRGLARTAAGGVVERAVLVAADWQFERLHRPCLRFVMRAAARCAAVRRNSPVPPACRAAAWPPVPAPPRTPAPPLRNWSAAPPYRDDRWHTRCAPARHGGSPECRIHGRAGSSPGPPRPCPWPAPAAPSVRRRRRTSPPQSGSD